MLTTTTPTHGAHAARLARAALLRGAPMGLRGYSPPAALDAEPTPALPHRHHPTLRTPASSPALREAGPSRHVHSHDMVPSVSLSRTPVTWETVAEGKRAVRDARIPTAWQLPNNPLPPLNVMDVPATSSILTDLEIKITETAAPQLVDLMVDHTYTSEQVVTAFCKRAAIAQQLTNCLTEIFFAQALTDARALDAHYAKTNEPAGPLHGLPVSIKDNFNLPGIDTSNGFVNYCHMPMTHADEADIARSMRQAGAILYCKTNVPTGILMGETYNNVWGYTSNPYNTDMTAGGSSGGEASLLALRGSPLGVGTDIGGSIRMPAGICGVYGLKPAGGRFPVIGIRPALPGQETIKATVGPMSQDLESLALWCKVVLGSKPWERDPTVFNLPWREAEVPEKLCFGMVVDDGMVRPTPAVARVLRETREAIEAAGHRVVEWSPPDPRTGIALLKRFLIADGGVRIGRVLKSDIHEPWPLQLRRFEQHYKRLRDGGAPPTVSGLWDMQAEKQRYLRRMLEAWTATRELTDTGRPFDAIISPVCAFPSAPRYSFRHAGYSGIWNMFDATSVAFPAGWASRRDVKTGESLRNDDERIVWDKYDPDRLDGMPVGLQLVTPRHTEELALKLTRLVVDAIGEHRH